MSHIIEISHLNKSFGEVKAVQDLSFLVKEGQLFALIKRNTKLFFKDKGMFFTSLITPIILLVLYMTFLENVYRDSFAQALPGKINHGYILTLLTAKGV